MMMFVETAGCCFGCCDSPVKVVGNVDVALRSGQQEHDEGVLQVTLKLYCLETDQRNSECGRQQLGLWGTLGNRGRPDSLTAEGF